MYAGAPGSLRLATHEPRQREALRAVDHALFAVLPVALTVWLLVHIVASGIVAVDFSHDFRAAGERILDGGNPYAWTSAQIAGGLSFPYPAAAGLLFVPFALLPAGLAGALFTAICLASALAALWALSVRDWRLYGLVLMWSPVVIGWQTGNLTLPLAFGSALAWRWRERPLRVGLIVAVLVSIKPIMLPLGLWLLATRRYRAAGYALLAGTLLNLLVWAVLGFDRIAAWLHLVSAQGDVLARKGYSLVALALDTGIGRGPGTGAELLAGAALALACIALGLRRREVQSFSVAVALVVVASPQVDLHYYALLILPLALARPRLSALWLAPLALWVCPSNAYSTGPVVFAWAITGAVLVCALSASSKPGGAGLRAGPNEAL